jgi:hypothetical protein
MGTMAGTRVLCTQYLLRVANIIPDAPEDLHCTFFFNVIVPLIGDVPTVFRGPFRQLISGPKCPNGNIKIFNGASWHPGDENHTGVGVWKLFLGLVPADHTTAGEFPLFEDNAGKSLVQKKERVVLVVDNS